MRLGQIEKWILTQIGNDDWDYKVEKKELRRGAGYDPDEHVKMAYENPDNKNISEKMVKKHLKRFQVSYSRALSNLIEKGLITRGWYLQIDLGLTEEQFSTVNIDPCYDMPAYPKQLVITFNDQFRNDDPEFDIPKCVIQKRICYYYLTDKGTRIKEERQLYPIYE